MDPRLLQYRALQPGPPGSPRANEPMHCGRRSGRRIHSGGVVSCQCRPSSSPRGRWDARRPSSSLTQTCSSLTDFDCEAPSPLPTIVVGSFSFPLYPLFIFIFRPSLLFHDLIPNPPSSHTVYTLPSPQAHPTLSSPRWSNSRTSSSRPPPLSIWLPSRLVPSSLTCSTVPVPAVTVAGRRLHRRQRQLQRSSGSRYAPTLSTVHPRAESALATPKQTSSSYPKRSPVTSDCSAGATRFRECDVVPSLPSRLGVGVVLPDRQIVEAQLGLTYGLRALHRA